MADGRYQVRTPGSPAMELSETQPFDGWGFICTMCRHTFPDSQKYVAFPPSRPCRASSRKVDLLRYADCSEWCTCFEREVVLQGTRRTGWPETVDELEGIH